MGSALFAAVAAIVATRVIERFGGKLGGLVGTLPSTIVPASIGLLNQSRSAEQFIEAINTAPAGMLLNVGFLWLWDSAMVGPALWLARGTRLERQRASPSA